ncbi:InlB B-repeat-containing protein [Bifidobacterium sp. wkB344]|uniref:RCC1 domain-containing protein n=1 Tax=Bifidobacterium sp. wkB344 TaxID=2025113 RepID=UPI00217D4EA3|nr:InlB B-repeat-containing protein [Bifidobacterium sp. wkB344]
MKTGTLATPLLQNPVREGFLFDGWTYNGQPFDFQTPILQNTTLKAKWTKTQDWKLNPDHGPASGAVLTISSPSSQEPYYTSIHSAGKQVVGLTGDGCIYTWTQDSTPIQVPSPAQAPDGFHYLQAAAGDQWQAALGSDQHIYTWNSQQPTPTILDTDRNIGFTSISLNDDRLLAVDRQGQVHAFQDSQKDTQNTNTKPEEQETTRLPGKTQAVTAVASSSRTLIMDTDGQAWTWDASNTGKAKPTSIKQDPGMRIIQAQTLNQGFLLLDADRQANYLADSTNSLTAVSLPDGVQTSRITANKDQAMITGTDGHVWAWKPGEAPKRTDNGNQQYMQAVESSSMIIAISRQGNIYKWSLDGQGQPGKPARLDTTQAPTLETASMDGQPLKLTKNNNSWQADIPARKPGTAAITITGRQDGQPFTRNLNYTVDQTLTRDDQQGTTHTVTFNATGGKPEPTHQTVSTPNGRVKRPSPNPTREGFLFDGWFIEQVAYDFSKPVTKDLTLTAKWTPAGRNSTWSISPDKGSQLGRESTTITPPDSASRGIRLSQVSSSTNNGATSNGFSLAVGSDGNAYAWGNNDHGQLGDGTTTNRTTPVMVRKPADTPADFTYVHVSAGWQHSLALGSDGYVYAWGYNGYGQLGNNSTPKGVYNSKAKSLIPVRVRDPAKPTDASKGLKAAQVSAGWGHSLAVGSDGYAYAWGYNGYGQLGNNSTRNSLVPVRVRDPDNPKDESRGLQAIQVSSGYGHSLAVGRDGYAYAWGYNYWGQLGNNNINSPSFPVHVRDPDKPTDTSKGLRAMQVSAEYANSLAVGSDGYAYAWGNNYRGQLGNNNNINSNSANPIPLRVRNPTSPTDKSQGLQTIQVSSGHDYSLAVGSDGYAYAWGKNSGSVPVRVRDPAKPTDSSKGLQATQVSTGWSHSLAVGSNGNAYAWGDNGAGQLGDGTKTDKSAPVLVSFNLQLVITGVRFDQTAVSGLTRGDNGSVSMLTPAHAPGTVTVSVDYTLGGAPQTPDTSLRYTYLPAGVLPRAGGEGILLALATGMTGMGGVLASCRHRREQHQLSHASHE